MIRGRNLLIGIVVVCAAGCGSSRRLNSGAAGIGGAGAQGGGTGGTPTGGAAGMGGAGAGQAGGTGGTSAGGAGGRGGAGAQGGGSGGVSASVCGARAPFGPRVSMVSGASGSSGAAGMIVSVYEGPATVERSTTDELLLRYVPSQAAPDGGVADPDGGASPTAPILHWSIRGLAPMLPFPLDAKLWVSTHVTDNPATFYHTDPWSLAVRDREGGTLLFGAALDPIAIAPSPVPIGSPGADCVVPDYKTGCTGNSNDTVTMTYESVAVQGDTAVVIHDSQPGKVSLGGVEYDVRLTARRIAPSCWFNSVNQDGIALDLQASNLSSLLAGLDVGPPLSCREGNDPSHGAYFDLNAIAEATYDGPVVFQGVEADTTTYDFGVPGLRRTDGTPAQLRIEGAAASMTVPSVGQQYWLSWASQTSVEVLRESQQGPIVLGVFYFDAQPDGAQKLADLLGTNVSLERQCAYTESIDLWDAVFGAAPGVRVTSGTSGTFSAGGHTYRAWVWGSSSAVGITIY
jgi:hypothetical protein